MFRRLLAAVCFGALVTACVIGPKPEDPTVTPGADTGTGVDAGAVLGDDGSGGADTMPDPTKVDGAADAPTDAADGDAKDGDDGAADGDASTDGAADASG